MADAIRIACEPAPTPQHGGEAVAGVAVELPDRARFASSEGRPRAFSRGGDARDAAEVAETLPR